ncbi:hypothetical protein [Archangium sp. Cb G35]|uniref:hypothetical protein n=1 Tax=Archangium sp. Cb G35 TaxID=1920190 RepID=UPI0009371568|nr:hypothetical protein [Archangium sp. Cb G35]
MQKKSAVEKRLDWLHDQWVEFAQKPQARLLRWVVEPDEVRMVEAWLKKEGDEQAGECPDLFLRFDVPFEQPEAYGFALREALLSLVEESGEQVPVGDPKPGQSGTAAFLSACSALQRQYADDFEVLALVLVPARVSSMKAWRQWLWEALDSLNSPQVRMVVLDDAEARVLEPMAQQEAQRVWTAVAALDVLGALREVAQQAGQSNVPGARYRELLALLAGAAQRGDLMQVQRLGNEAVDVASAEGWHALTVAAHWAVAGSLLVAGKPQNAAERYQQAEAAAAEAEAGGQAHGAELRLKTRLALGSALIAGQQLSSAALVYEDTVPLARKLTDSHLELECWRMASFCHESLRALDEAWATGQQAWALGQTLESRARATSTLPYVAETLVRLSFARQGADAARRMESEADSLLGQDWRTHLQASGGQTT